MIRRIHTGIDATKWIRWEAGRHILDWVRCSRGTANISKWIHFSTRFFGTNFSLNFSWYPIDEWERK